MRVAVSSTGTGLEAQASPTFGRCTHFAFVDAVTMDCETLDNPAAGSSGGAGIQAAEFVAREGVEAVLTGRVGPNAARVLEAAGVDVQVLEGGTVREAVEAFRLRSGPDRD